MLSLWQNELTTIGLLFFSFVHSSDKLGCGWHQYNVLNTQFTKCAWCGCELHSHLEVPAPASRFWTASILPNCLSRCVWLGFLPKFHVNYSLREDLHWEKLRWIVSLLSEARAPLAIADRGPLLTMIILINCITTNTVSNIITNTVPS